MNELVTLKKPQYAIFGSRGEVVALYCKVCGVQIAHTDRRGFRRSPSYIEAKLLCDDGSAHVTSGCRRCMSLALEPETLTQMLRADMAMEPTGYSEKDKRRTAVRVVNRGLGIP